MTVKELRDQLLPANDDAIVKIMLNGEEMVDLQVTQVLRTQSADLLILTTNEAYSKLEKSDKYGSGNYGGS